MKSEQEIKNMRNLYKEIVTSGSKITSDNKSKQTKIAIEENKRIVKMLDWVLEDSEPKRTIFDLTEEELIELCGIIISQEYCTTSTINQMQINIEHIFFCYTQYWFNQNNRKEELPYYISLDVDLGIEIELFGQSIAMRNITKYSDRIREMLSKPKEE